MPDMPQQSRIQGTIAGQTLALETRSIVMVTILLIVLIGLGGYVIYSQLDQRFSKGFELLHEEHGKVEALLERYHDNISQEHKDISRNLRILGYNLTQAPERHLPLGINGPSPEVK